MISQIKVAIQKGDLKPKIIYSILGALKLTNKKLRVLEVRYFIFRKIKKKYFAMKSAGIAYPVTLSKNTKFKDTIWICWFQGENNAPELVKKCIRSIKKYNQDHNIIVLDKNNYKEYVHDIPGYIIQKWETGIISNAQFSDIFRLSLLVENGGLWLDSTVFLTGAIPKYVWKCDLFMFKHFEDTDLAINSASWFIKANPNNVILRQTRDCLFEFWKKENKIMEYFLMHLFVTLVSNDNKDAWDAMIKIPDNISHILAENVMKPYNEIYFQIIKDLTSVHKLSNKFNIGKGIIGTYYEKILNGEL